MSNRDFDKRLICGVCGEIGEVAASGVEALPFMVTCDRDGRLCCQTSAHLTAELAIDHWEELTDPESE